MKGRLLAWSGQVPGGLEGLGEDLLAERFRGLELEEPLRPPELPLGRWRRMSRLSRLAATVTLQVLRGRDLAPDSLPFVVGSAMGEVVPSSAFLDRLVLEGPDRGSPTAFQNSVWNAIGAHLSIAFGLRGPGETVSAGMATGLASLARGIELLAHAPNVLVVVVDDRNPTTLRAMGERPCGEAALALLLARGEGIEVVDGEAAAATFRRGTGLPYERDFQPAVGLRPEAAVGLHPANGLLAALVTGTWATEEDDGYTISGRIRTT